MTVPPPTLVPDPQTTRPSVGALIVAQTGAAISTPSPALRYVLASVLMTFAMAMGLILVWFKEPVSWVDAALITPAMLFGFALAAPKTLASVAGLIRDVLPAKFGGKS